MVRKIAVLLEQTLTILFWVLIIFGFDSPGIACLTLVAAVIHECGHLLPLIKIRSSGANLPRAGISGFRIKISQLSYKEELIVALCGPLINIILALLCLSLPLHGVLNAYFDSFAILNILTGVSNLMPIEGYDGYKALLSMARLIFKNHTAAERTLSKLSFALSAIICFFSLYLMLKLGEGYWIFGIFFTSLLSSIIRRQKYTFFENK